MIVSSIATKDPLTRSDREKIAKVVSLDMFQPVSAGEVVTIRLAGDMVFVYLVGDRLRPVSKDLFKRYI